MAPRKRLDSSGILNLLANRQVDERFNRQVQANLQVTESAIRRLGLEKELEGHTGCVNCLEWNESGTILASASDDLHLNLWDPFRYRQLLHYDSGHRGNIFSAKFMPQSSSGVVVTGAGDNLVKVHDVVELKTTRTCSCHNNRVKRIATAPNVPFLFWTAAEDGFVMEVDLRAEHSCSEATNNVLVNLSQHMGGKDAEAKCLAINPSRPEQLAVGANDPFIRIFDRRMIRSYSIVFGVEETRRRMRGLFMQSYEGDNMADGCAQYFVAGHLAKENDPTKRRKHRTHSTTYLTFSPSGTHLLANIGAEQIYLFDINNKTDRKQFDPRQFHPSACSSAHSCPTSPLESRRETRNRRQESDATLRIVEHYLHTASTHMNTMRFTSAIQEYNKAISLCPKWPQLHSKRAVAYMKRKWDGDIYAALRDCQLILSLDPNYHMAHFWIAKCLFGLSYVEEAVICLENFKTKFPEDAFSHGYKKLMTSLQNTLKHKKENGVSNSAGAVSDISDPDEEISASTARMNTLEQKWKDAAGDYEARFCGHCNTTTDIKEANFFGSEGQFIVAGSDDGSFFVWDALTTNLVKGLRGDSSIVNCLQPHPTACLLATSGIDPTVRLWSPKPEDGRPNERIVDNVEDVATENQRRMNTDPFEAMLINMGYALNAQGGIDGPAEPNVAHPNVYCNSS